MIFAKFCSFGKINGMDARRLSESWLRLLAIVLVRLGLRPQLLVVQLSPQLPTQLPPLSLDGRGASDTAGNSDARRSSREVRGNGRLSFERHSDDCSPFWRERDIESLDY
jgi:hypothetical protein